MLDLLGFFNTQLEVEARSTFVKKKHQIYSVEINSKPSGEFKNFLNVD